MKMEVKGETDEFDRPERNDGGDDDDEYIPGEPSLSLHLRVLLVADLASAESICR